jgi:threonine dehydrogenase-like Zn-dependent dehydrogenase
MIGEEADVEVKDAGLIASALRELLLEKIEAGQIDPSFIITHLVSLEEAATAYKTFRDKEDGCIKVVLKPSGQ